MIASLNGKIIRKSSTEIVIECGGVGYSAMISLNSSSNLPDVGSNGFIYTILIPREDSLQLFGFSDEQEREAFKMLITIAGIGPKTALGILSSVTPENLADYIMVNNISALKKLPGIGIKTAERISLELKDKIFNLLGTGKPGEKLDNLIIKEALSALVTLGYNRLTAEKAIKKALSDFPEAAHSAELLIRKALQAGG